jgi:hypothetical protein
MATKRNTSERPRAFISHDSRDKEKIAEPLAAALQNFMCPVWFDKFSLKVGDSLKAEHRNRTNGMLEVYFYTDS